MKVIKIDENLFNSHYQKLQFHDLDVTQDNIKSLFCETVLITQNKPVGNAGYEYIFKFIQNVLDNVDKNNLSLLKDRSTESFGADIMFLYIVQTKEYDTKLIGESYLRDYLIINSLLKNLDLCMSILDKLESNLQAWVDSEEYKNYQPELIKREQNQKRTGPIRKHDHFFLPPKVDEEKSEKFKILISYFQHWAIQNGYKFAKLKGLLEEGDFFTLIGEGRLLGDKGVFEKHGEWPHAIQQFIISEYYKGNFESKLTHKPIDLYAKLGNPECQSERSGEYFWDDLYDQQENLRPKNDFRSPERLMTFIKSNKSEARYPLLSACIKREEFGFEKRTSNKTGGRDYKGEDKIKRLDEEDIESLFKKK